MQYGKESYDRLEKIRILQEAGVIVYASAYPNKQDVSTLYLKAQDASYIYDIDTLMSQETQGQFRIAGRIMLSRCMGKLLFMKLRDQNTDIQICFVKDKLHFYTGNTKTSPSRVTSLSLHGEEKTAFKIAEKWCQVGDYIGVCGDLFYTKHGELTIYVREFQILSKAVRSLPEKFHGIKDIEILYRQRYLDMIMHRETYDRFRLKSKFIHTLRQFYYENDFIEVETPILGNAASGAVAQPFVTHHHDFNEDFYLRIAPETALKKVTVGGFERVVEFARNFRNEGSDPSHMQEFSVIEHYTAWWNYEDNIRFTEMMFDYIFDHIPELSRQIDVKDKYGNIKKVDFTTPWKRIDYISGVKEKSGIDVSQYTLDDADRLRKDIQDAGYAWEGIDAQGTASMIDYLYKKVLRPDIIGPACIYNYPKTMQPLARQSDEYPENVEQFQLVINGWEVVKAYSELVDPKIQKENFVLQSSVSAKGDDEITVSDDDFLLAMEYGMPPQSGWGMGVDRIFSLLTGQDNLRDVVLFPLMKSLHNEDEKEGL